MTTLSPEKAPYDQLIEAIEDDDENKVFNLIAEAEAEPKSKQGLRSEILKWIDSKSSIFRYVIENKRFSILNKLLDSPEIYNPVTALQFAIIFKDIECLDVLLQDQRAAPYLHDAINYKEGVLFEGLSERLSKADDEKERNELNEIIQKLLKNPIIRSCASKYLYNQVIEFHDSLSSYKDDKTILKKEKLEKLRESTLKALDGYKDLAAENDNAILKLALALSSDDLTVNKILLEKHKELEPFMQVLDRISRVGHVLGLDGKMLVPKSIIPSDYERNFEGMNAFNKSAQVIIEKLQNRVSNLSSTENKVENENLNIILESFKKATTQPIETQNYEADQLTIISSGWEGHAVYIAVYNGYLVVSNRGDDGDQNFGSKIYKLKATDKDTMVSILNTLNQMEIPGQPQPDMFVNSEAFFKEVSQLVDIKNPIVSFPQKGQEHGNCSYANAKALIEPCHFLLDCNRKEISIEKPSKESSAFQKLARKRYKSATLQFRDTEIDTLIKDLGTASTDSEKSLIINLLAKIYILHHGEGCRTASKKEEELNRAAKIYLALTNNKDFTPENCPDYNNFRFVHYILDLKKENPYNELTKDTKNTVELLKIKEMNEILNESNLKENFKNAVKQQDFEKIKVILKHPASLKLLETDIFHFMITSISNYKQDEVLALLDIAEVRSVIVRNKDEFKKIFFSVIENYKEKDKLETILIILKNPAFFDIFKDINIFKHPKNRELIREIMKIPYFKSIDPKEIFEIAMNYNTNLLHYLYKDVYTINKKMSVKESSYFKNVDRIKRAGHILGLPGRLLLPESFDSSRYSSFLLTGQDVRGSIGYLVDSLNNRISKIEPSIEDTERDNLVKIKESLEIITTNSFTADNYDSNQLMIVPCGYPGHAIYLAFYKDKLIVCNRGAYGDQSFGSKIYNLKTTDPKEIIPIIKKISKVELMELNSGNKNIFFKELQELIDPKNPIQTFSQKGQEYGTCSLANVKALIEPCHYLLDYERNITQLDSHPEEIILKKSAKSRYKSFTKELRDNELNNLIESFKKSSSKTDKILIMNLLVKIYIEHHGVKSREKNKKKDEVGRAAKIYATLAKDEDFNYINCPEYTFFNFAHGDLLSSKNEFSEHYQSVIKELSEPEKFSTPSVSTTQPKNITPQTIISSTSISSAQTQKPSQVETKVQAEQLATIAPVKPTSTETELPQKDPSQQPISIPEVVRPESIQKPNPLKVEPLVFSPPTSSKPEPKPVLAPAQIKPKIMPEAQPTKTSVQPTPLATTKPFSEPTQGDIAKTIAMLTKTLEEMQPPHPAIADVLNTLKKTIDIATLLIAVTSIREQHTKPHTFLEKLQRKKPIDEGTLRTLIFAENTLQGMLPPDKNKKITPKKK